MKKLLILLGVILILGGCASAPENDKQADDPGISASQESDTGTGDITVNINNEVEIKDTSGFEFLIYKQWAIPWQDTANVMPFGYNQTDCIGLANGANEAGDLLSTLIADQEFIKYYRLKTNIYTPAYVSALEKKLSGYTQKTASSDYYAFYVCHLADGIDITAGYYWPHGEQFVSSYDLKGEQAQRHLLLVNNDSIIEINNVQILDNTLTGGEVDTCRAELIDNQINWKCISPKGFQVDDEGMTSAIHMNNYLIDLNGKIIKEWETVDKN
ncbi:hypothetical protein ACFL2U_03105 [Patescibacteria group bacterium]